MSATYTPRRVRDEDERGAYSSEFLQLDKGEKFIGYALFVGDPKAPEKGYFEYWEHYDPGLGKRGQSVPCAGPDDCPYCKDDDKPRNRAKSAWLVLQVNDKKLAKPELRTFTMGPQVIRQVSELRTEGDKIKGRLFRISRPEDREYVVAPKTETIKVSEVSEALKGVNDFEKALTNTLKRSMERTLMSRAMNDEEDDAPATSRRDNGDEPKGKAGKGKTAKPETQEWPDQLTDVTVLVVEADGDGNFFTAKHDDYDGEKNVYTTEGIEFDLSELSEDQEVTVTAELDGDGDYILQSEPEVEAAADPEDEDTPAESDLPDKIEGETFVINAIDNGGGQTMEVENDELGLSFTLFFLDKGPGSDTDLDDYAVGEKIIVHADKDTEGDMCAVAVPEKVSGKGAKGAAKGAKGAAAKKGK